MTTLAHLSMLWCSLVFFTLISCWLVQHFPQVLTYGFPPLEDREKSLKTFFYGGTLTKEQTVSLKFSTLVHNSQISYSFPIVFLLNIPKRLYFSYTLAIDQTGRDGKRVWIPCSRPYDCRGCSQFWTIRLVDRTVQI